MEDNRASQAAAERAWAQKTALIAEVRKLTAMLATDYQGASRRMQDIQQLWATIGRTGSDSVEDALWQQFRAAHDDFFAAGKHSPRARARGQAEIRGQKLRIIDEAERISHNTEWVSTELVFRRLFDEWRQTGQLDPADEAKLVEQFKHAWERFTGARRAYFAELKRQADEAVHAKETLVHQVLELVELTDVDEAKAKIVELDAKWKAATPIPPMDEERLWGQFQQAQIDVVNTIEETRRRREEAELSARQSKETLIRQAENLLRSDDFRTAKDDLRQLMAAWKSVGTAGAELDQALYERFTQTIDRVYHAIESAAEDQRRELIRRLEDAIYDRREEIDEIKRRLIDAEDRLADMLDRRDSPRDRHDWEAADRRAAAIAAQRERIAKLEDDLAEVWDEIGEIEDRLRSLD